MEPPQGGSRCVSGRKDIRDWQRKVCRARQSSDSSLLRAALLILLGVLLGLVVILVAARLLGGQWLQRVKAVPSVSVLHTSLMQSFLE